MNAGSQVLRPGRESKADGSRQPYSARADISIRLWTASHLQGNPDISWKTSENLVFMISDVVTANQGVPADELRSGMSARFHSAGQAVKAAKAIERSMVEFCKQRPDDCFGAAIVVHRPIELRPFLEGDPTPVSPASFLLRQAQPGQILVGHDMYEHIRDLPGLKFRPLNAADQGATSGDNELLWTSAEAYAGLAARLQEAIRSRPIPEPSSHESSEKDLAINPAPAKASDVRVPAFSTARLSALPADENEPNWMSSHRLLVALAAVVVLAAALFYALPGLRKNRPAANSSVGSQADNPQPAARQQPPQNNPPASPALEQKSEPVPSLEGRKQAVKPVQPPKGSESRAASEYAGFYASDIPALLRRAQADAGAGDYDSARHEYDIILHLDPNNQAARTGVSRLNLSKDRK